MGGSLGARAQRRTARACFVLAVAGLSTLGHAQELEIVEPSADLATPRQSLHLERRDLLALGVGSVTRGTATEALNRELRAVGYDSVSSVSQQLSFCVWAAFKHVRLGFDAGGEIGMRRATRESDGAGVEVSEFLGSVNLGYEVYSEAPFVVFPHAGFAFGATDVSLPAQTSFSLEPSNRAPPPDRYLHQAATALRLGFVVEHPIVPTLRDTYGQREAVGLLVSFGAGYLVPLQESNWELVEEREEVNSYSDLVGGPIVPLGGPYAQLAIGVAWYAGRFAP